MRPALVVLAAGASRRLGRCKAIVPLGGRSPLERLVAAAGGLADGPDAGGAVAAARPLVVVGAHEDEIRAHVAAAGLEVDVVANESWPAGRSGSLAVAARARPGRDLCVAPVDVPLVGRAVFAALAEAWRAAGAPQRGWLGPLAEEPAGGALRHGHPVIVGRGLAEGLSTFPPDRPLRELRAAARPLLEVAVADPAVLDDLDTPADLSTLRERIGRE